MKRKKIESISVKAPARKTGKQIKAQVAEGYLILDVWEDKNHKLRHAMDIKTGEYATYKNRKWTEENFENAVDETYNYWSCGIDERQWKITKADKDIITEAFGSKKLVNVYGNIRLKEEKYNREKRWQKEDRRQKRIDDLMSLCPSPGVGIREWVVRTATGDKQYAFYNKQTKNCHCTACDGDFSEEAAGARIKHRVDISCPICGHDVTVIKGAESVKEQTRLTIIHNVDNQRGVQRHFVVTIRWNRIRTVEFDEIIRMMLMRSGKHIYKVYYNTGWGGWTEGNRANKRWKTGYLYPGTEIKEALQGTAYDAWQDVLPQLAAAGIEADYNRLLVEHNLYFARMTEYLFKGRFFRLLKDTSEQISYYSGYTGNLKPEEETIEDVMQIKDRQLINRLRQENGGAFMHKWLQWMEESENKISAECLNWLESAGISPAEYTKSGIDKYISIQQAMNYITRQIKESYKGKTVIAVWEQYSDYLDMAKKLGKKMDDEMVYRPRELKRRHDECTEEYHRRREEMKKKEDAEYAERQAQLMREKYPGYEDILQEVKEKFEYENGTYLIRVPEDFGEITAEGVALHHCAGNSERYFDRIVNRETYICFLRQQSSPEQPYYTIEVEPGGTIRQHRGAYDEEPGIEEIKPFLKEWQKVIRKRMSREDHEYAKASEVLRRKNIEELRAKNNTRVLDGLMEDLMEVI